MLRDLRAIELSNRYHYFHIDVRYHLCEVIEICQRLISKDYIWILRNKRVLA